jgi:hypothetical protein
LPERSRLADFAELLHALDRVTDWRSLDAFTGAQDALNDAGLDGHPVAAALREWPPRSLSRPAVGKEPWPSCTGNSTAAGVASPTAGPKPPPCSAPASARWPLRSAPAASTSAAASGSNEHGKAWTVTYAPTV